MAGVETPTLIAQDDIAVNMPQDHPHFAPPRPRRWWNSTSCTRNQYRLVYLLALLLSVILFYFYKNISFIIVIVVAIFVLTCVTFARCLLRHSLRARRYQQYQQLQNDFPLTPMRPSRTHLRLTMINRDFTPNDYEMLLRLDDESRSRLTGMPQSEIERLPSYLVPAFKTPEGGEDDEVTKKKHQCPICLEQKAPGDTVRTLPCLHTFHVNCVDRWLRIKPECPVCKYQISLSEAAD
jgi:E3 ubiquitin-protein ligase SDIR1